MKNVSRLQFKKVDSTYDYDTRMTQRFRCAPLLYPVLNREKINPRLLCGILHLCKRHHLHKQRLLFNAQRRRRLLIQRRVLALESCPRDVLLDKETHADASRTRQRLFKRRIRIDRVNEAEKAEFFFDFGFFGCV